LVPFPRRPLRAGFRNVFGTADGTFWMEYTDFKKLFCEVSIVRVRDSFVVNSAPLPALGAGQLMGVELTIRDPTTCCVELHQSSKRCFPTEAFTFQYGGVIMEVVSTTPPALLGTSQPAKSSSVFVELELQPGKYIIVCRGAVDRKRKVAVSTYSSAPVGLSVMSTSRPGELVGARVCCRGCHQRNETGVRWHEGLGCL
jgi:hypothetical protein